MANALIHVVHPFPPLYDEYSQILILGSFPSVKSREQRFFYGHPQNRFWPLIARLYGEDTPGSIEEKEALPALYKTIGERLAALERKRRELERTERPILPEERCADLNDALCALQADDRVSVRYYRRGAQRTIRGAVTHIDGTAHALIIDRTRIAFADLLDIQRL